MAEKSEDIIEKIQARDVVMGAFRQWATGLLVRCILLIFIAFAVAVMWSTRSGSNKYFDLFIPPIIDSFQNDPVHSVNSKK